MMLARYIIGLTAIIHVTAAIDDKPNLVIIMTDEHNMRTLGCYRSLQSEPFLSERHIWGDDVKVKTPNIDSLARSGAIFTNFNAVAPLCTPSRSSFLSGLYPHFTGASENHKPMNEDVVTFAQILQEKGKYETGYVGKWHLNGAEKPGFSNKKRRFGFASNKYQFNRGHYKLFEEDKKTGKIDAYEMKQKHRLNGNINDAYATDFLFSKGISFIKKKIKKKQNFALMMSIPDPHGPNDVRAPYDTMYNNMTFTLPLSAVKAYHKTPALPRWSKTKVTNTLENANATIKRVESSDEWQTHMRNYFGMVKLIDDKIGDLLVLLKESDQAKNTIIVFTSDHGDMMGEHASYNKGTPYHGSAGVPFIIRYPARIKKGKVIETAYSSPDFAPTILSIMGIDHNITFQGVDGSDEILNDSVNSKIWRTRFIMHPKDTSWVAAVNGQYKLVLARLGEPWLFDMMEDPHEIVNYAADPDHSKVMLMMQYDMVNAIDKYELPFLVRKPIYLDRPACYDTNDQIPGLPYLVCNDLKQTKHASRCELEEVRNFCRDTCGGCCKDSSGLLLHDGKLQSCSDFVNQQRGCDIPKISAFCPITCSSCTPAPLSRPSLFPSSEPSLLMSKPPTVAPTPVQTTTVPTTETPTSAPTTTGSTCKDSKLKFILSASSNDSYSCVWVGQNKVERCPVKHASLHCPKTCGTCEACLDSTASFIYKGKKQTCLGLQEWSCKKVENGLTDTCRVLCGTCDVSLNDNIGRTPTPTAVASTPFKNTVVPTTRAPIPVQITAAPTTEDSAQITKAPTPAQTTAVPTPEDSAQTTEAPIPAETTSPPTNEDLAQITESPGPAQTTTAPTTVNPTGITKAPTPAQTTTSPTTEDSVLITESPTLVQNSTAPSTVSLTQLTKAPIPAQTTLAP